MTRSPFRRVRPSGAGYTGAWGRRGTGRTRGHDRGAATKGPTTMAGSKRQGSGKDLAKGDTVAWKSHGSTTEGEVERKLTKRTEAAGRTVDASPDDPQYEVRSAKSGKRAVHKPSSLRKK